MFLEMPIDMGVGWGILKHKEEQPQDEGATKKKNLDCHDRAKGKDVETEGPVFG